MRRPVSVSIFQSILKKYEKKLTILLQAVLSNVQQLLLKKRNQSFNDEDTITEEDIKQSPSEEYTLQLGTFHFHFRRHWATELSQMEKMP